MDDIDKFKDATSAFLQTWKAIEVKAIANLDTETLLSMVGCLSPEPPRPPDVTEPMSGIVFIREALPISELDTLLSGWQQGAITLGPYQLSASEFTTSHFSGLLSGPWEDSILGWPQFRGYRQFLIYSYGSRNVEVILGPKDITAIARVLGFASFAELCVHRVQFPISGGYMTRMEVFAPLFAVIETKAETTRLGLTVKIHQALRAEGLSLSYRVQDRKGYRLEGGSIDGTEFQRADLGYMTALSSSIVLPDASASGELHLLYDLYKSRQEPIASARFEVPPAVGLRNPQHELVLSLISNTRAWTKLGMKPEETIEQWLGLSQPRPRQEEFERAIAILLFATGLPVLSMTGAEGVDQVVLVTEPNQLAVVISCTTSPDLGNKIATVSLQRNRVKERLPDFSVHASIFAPVEYTDLRLGDIEDCKSQGISMVLRLQIQDLLHQIRGVDWPEAKERLLQVITRPPSDHIPL